MIVHFAKWGNSIAVRVPSAHLRQLGLGEGAAADMVVEDGKLVIKPVAETPSYELDELLAGITEDNLHEEMATGHAVGNEFF